MVTGHVESPADFSEGPVSILTLELDAANPPLLLGDWLGEAGGVLDIRRLHAGEPVPTDATGFDALLVLGAPFSVYDDETAPFLRPVRALLATTVAASTPTLAVGLGGQLLAVAAGGRVARPDDGAWRLGANLTAKRDATEQDILFGLVPITPDVMQFRRDTITALPGGGRLLLNSLTDPVEAFRVGSAAWGMQFHIETPAETLRAWQSDPRWNVPPEDLARSDRRFGAALDESAELMAHSWRAVAHRFVALVREGIPATPTGRGGPRLPIVSTDLGH